MITKPLTNANSVFDQFLLHTVSGNNELRYWWIFIIGAVLIDLHKAFNTIDHQTLFKQMRCVGFAK